MRNSLSDTKALLPGHRLAHWPLIRSVSRISFALLPLYIQPSMILAQVDDAKPQDLMETRRWLHNSDPLEGMPLLIETSPPVANLLMRAEEGLQRRDWKLAIDSLQRVIDDRSGTLVPREDYSLRDGLIFESARRRAVRQLATLPAEGMLAYRVLYDGKAKGLFERARAASDEEAMKAVADRFLLTRYGDDASDWAASQALDEGRFAEAAGRLTDLLSFVPDHDVPDERIYAKLYAAFLLMGYPDDAARSLEDYRRHISTSEHPGDRSSAILDGLSEEWARQVQERVAAAEETEESLPRRRGPQLDPTLKGLVPWEYELTGTASELWRRIVDFRAGDPPPVPRMNLISNGRQLFVRTPAGCTALDMEDLTLVWQAASASLPRPSQIDDQRRMLNPALNARTTGPYVDDPINLIAHAHGLVFTIERQGTSEFMDRDEVQAGGVLFVRPGPRTLRMVTGTRLTAYDSQTGDIRWQRGRTDDAEDTLASVRFLSTPIAVNDQLWVPFLRGLDLLVGALRPSDGALLKQALIGSIREPSQGREQAPLRESVTPMTLAEGVAYVPTGVGAVAAIDVAGMQVKWTFVYDVQSGGRRRADTANRWIASAPLVESGTVVLAATDSETVLGINAATGALRWSVAAQNCSYPIAADRGKVWLGGQRIACLSLADGHELWSTTLSGTPTGKAAFCGDQIQVPTSQGLLTLDALSGEQRAVKELPTSQAPLGNIACVGSSLYSLEPSSVRKFADLNRMHEIAMRQIEANPHDTAAVIRLAWSELLRGKPREAFDAIRDLTENRDMDIRLRMGLARVRIESLLSMSQESDSPKESLSLLQSANSADLTPLLRLRFQSAIADQLAALGRSEEAFSTLMALALSSDADELNPSGDGVRIAALIALCTKIEKLRSQLDAPTNAKLMENARKRVAGFATESALSSSGRRELLALARVYEGTETAQLALLKLAESQEKAREYEVAEQFLMQCMRTSGNPALAREAGMRLSTMYMESNQLAAGLLNHSIDFLKTLPETDPDKEELITKLRGSITDDRLLLAMDSLYADAGSERACASLSGRQPWNYDAPPEGEPVRVVHFDRQLPRALADRALILGREGFLECLRLDPKEVLWRTKLELPGGFDDVPDSGMRSQSVTRYGAIDGQTVILNGPDGIFAVGALTGRLLWARPFDHEVMDLTGSAARDHIMAASNGYVVAAPRDGYLTMIRVADGSTIWERDLRGEILGHVWLEDNAVVFADPDMKRVHLVGREDGRLISRILLRQPDPEHDRVTLALSQGLLFGPEGAGGNEGVAAYDTSTGSRRWRAELSKPVVTLFVPRPGYVGVGMLGGDVTILDARSGDVVLQRSDPSVRAVTGGVMWAGTLILRSNALRGPKQTLELAAFDIATSTEIWRRKDVVALATPDEGLDVISGVIPAIIEKSKSDDKLRQSGGTRLAALVTLIDVRTGNDAGTPAELTGIGQGISLNGDLMLWPGVLAVGSMKGFQGFRVDLTALPERGF